MSVGKQLVLVPVVWYATIKQCANKRSLVRKLPAICKTGHPTLRRGCDVHWSERSNGHVYWTRELEEWIGRASMTSL